MRSLVHLFMDVVYKASPVQKRHAMVTVHCRGCGRTEVVPRDKKAPAGTAYIDCLCPRCDVDDFDGVLYFDADKKQIVVE